MSSRKNEQQAKGKSSGVHKKRKRQKEKKSSTLAPVSTFNSSNITQNRITRNGLFLHGRTSSRVSRAPHFMHSEEHQARVNEDLHKILDLASCVPNRGRDLIERHSNHGEESSTNMNCSTNDAREGERIAKEQDDSYSLYYMRNSAEMCGSSNEGSNESGNSPLSTGRQTGEESTNLIPNSVLEGIAKELIDSIGLKLQDLMPRKDGTLQQTRRRLQRIHRQSFKNNLISGKAAKSMNLESLHNAAIFPPASTDVADCADKDFRLLDSCLSAHPFQCAEKPKVKIPFQSYCPVPGVQSADVGNRLMPEACIPSQCDTSRNTACGTAVLPISTNSDRLNRRQLYPPQSSYPPHCQQAQDPSGMDILDYVDSNIDIVSDNNPTLRIPFLPHFTPPFSTMQPNPRNPIGPGAFPTLSPIAVPPFFNPAPRFYRRKVY